MNIDVSELRRVAQVDGYRKHQAPRWSHDGKQLAFETRAGPNKAQKFFVVNADGTTLREMGERALPDWSPDDKQIVFHCLGGANQKPGMGVQNLDGKGHEWLAVGLSPRWSPDGSQLATTNGRLLTLVDLVGVAK